MPLNLTTTTQFNLLMDPLVGQEKKRKKKKRQTLGGGRRGGQGGKFPLLVNSPHNNSKCALVTNGNDL